MRYISLIIISLIVLYSFKSQGQCHEYEALHKKFLDAVEKNLKLSLEVKQLYADLRLKDRRIIELEESIKKDVQAPTVQTTFLKNQLKSAHNDRTQSQQQLETTLVELNASKAELERISNDFKTYKEKKEKELQELTRYTDSLRGIIVSTEMLAKDYDSLKEELTFLRKEKNDLELQKEITAAREGAHIKQIIFNLINEKSVGIDLNIYLRWDLIAKLLSEDPSNYYIVIHVFESKRISENNPGRYPPLPLPISSSHDLTIHSVPFVEIRDKNISNFNASFQINTTHEEGFKMFAAKFNHFHHHFVFKVLLMSKKGGVISIIERKEFRTLDYIQETGLYKWEEVNK